MNVRSYFEKYSLVDMYEIEKVEYFAYYYLVTERKTFFNRNDILEWFQLLNLPKPNISRLISKIKRSKNFTKGKDNNTFQLHPKKILDLKDEIQDIDWRDEEIESNGEIVPDAVVENTRGYVENISRQINASYANNIFDGCAVLMRRLIEILLILIYKNINEENKIMGTSGRYKELSKIIGEAITNGQINLSQDSKDCIDEFRQLGNFSAHKIEYNCRRADICKIALKYRATVEELLYKAGLKI